MHRALRILGLSLLLLAAPLYSQFQQTSPGKAIQDAARISPPPSPEQKPSTPTTATVLNDTHGFDMMPYLDGAVLPRVRDRWHAAIPEFIADPNARNGVTIVEFRILRDGEVEDLKVTQSAGTPEMDEAAFQAVMRSSPFRALPKALVPDHLQMRFHFYYRGKGSSKWWKRR